MSGCGGDDVCGDPVDHCGIKVQGKQINVKSVIQEIKKYYDECKDCCTTPFDHCHNPFSPHTGINMGSISSSNFVHKDRIDVGKLPFKCYVQKLNMGTL